MYAKGVFFQQEEEWNDAISTYSNIIKIAPDYKTAHFNLGVIHYEYLKVYDVAREHFSNAIRSDPAYAEAYCGRGHTFEAVGNVAAAEADYRKALEIRPDYTLAAQALDRARGH